jgi:1-acyl-sn-glycerol-3-phosphate acyltransferase
MARFGRAPQRAAVATQTKSPWPRRALTFPLVALAASIGTSLAPLLFTLALAHDVVRFALSRRPFMLVRLVAFALFYAWAELVGLAVLGLVWLASLTSREREGTLVARTYAVQRRWAHALFVFARWLLSLRFEVEGDAHVEPGPVIVLVNHASLLDTLLPTIFVTHAHDLRLRFVLKEELLVSPCLDVAGLRLPNVFVDRSSTQTGRELERIRALSSHLGPREGAILYPEGTRMTPKKRERALAKLATDDPALHAEAQELTRVMPPRFGGASALLDGAPEADVLLLAHRGLEGFAHFGDFLAGSLVGTTIHLRFWRVPRAEVPTDREGRARWLLREWRRVDAFVAEGRARG